MEFDESHQESESDAIGESDSESSPVLSNNALSGSSRKRKVQIKRQRKDE